VSAFQVAVAEPVELAERPLWDDRVALLRWVDILAGDVHSLASDGTHEVRHVGEPVGSIGLRAGGGIVVARGGGLLFLDGDGHVDRPEISLDLAPQTRFNDGACDPAGRFWIGTCATDGVAGRGVVYRVDPDGAFAVVLRDVSISNGLAWSLDGTTVYYVDSGDPCIRAYPYDVATGALGARRDLVVFGPGDGVPDGLIVDAEGAIWVAMWEGGCVRRYAPDGALLARIATPTSRPTCPAFGGAALDRLYVTTAWEDMTPAERAAEPLAGTILVADVGVRGLPALRFAG
jgi:sugar lactone lactonase YvrE